MSSIVLLAAAIVVSALVVFFVLLKVAIFFTHLFETRPLRPFVPAPADDPEHAKLAPAAAAPSASGEEHNPYASPQQGDYATGRNKAASAQGLTPHGLYVHAKGGAYKVHATIWTTSDRRVLALVGWGTAFGLAANQTLLYSRLDDGKVLLTCDKLPGIDVPGFYEIAVVLNAPFDLLVRRHGQRIAASGRAVTPFDDADVCAEYESILRRRHEILVDRKEEYYVNPERTAVRSTLKGALIAFGRSFQIPRYVEKVGPEGKPVPLRVPADDTPAPLRYARWFFNSLFLVGAVVGFQHSPVTASRPLLPLAILAVALFGSVAVWVISAVLKAARRRRYRA
jgi:hypothetical protein